MTSMFTPADAITTTLPIERIALIGPPGAGKTTSMQTFPNLIVGDIDKKCPPGITSIPMWNPEWADKLANRTRKSDGPNFRDAIKRWLRENHDKFTEDQTFALDSWSFLQDCCDMQTAIEDSMTATSTGKQDGFFFWKQKLMYSKEVMGYLKKMKCRVVVTFHETIDRNPDGTVNGKIRPAMDGSYKDVILGNFTDVWRARANIPVLDDTGKVKRDSQGKVITGGFVWQLMGDSVVDLNTNPLLGRICREKKITTVPVTVEGTVIQGGYHAIQELYASSGA